MRFELTYSHVELPRGAHPLVFPFAGTDLLLASDARLPSDAALQELGAPLYTFRFGILDGQACEMRVWPRTHARHGFFSGDYRALWGCWPRARLDALCRARQLAAWIAWHRFCGVCGQAATLNRQEPSLDCPACGHKAYPRISPVVMGLVWKEDAMLLARAPHFPPGVYSALAGFVEAGETAEQALAREVREESGVEIRNLRYFDSQSWPYPHSLMLGFFADYHSGDLVPQESEIEDLGWFHFDRLPTLPHPGSLAFRMIVAMREKLATGEK
ncbi:MAG: NAD(+) diphosphatase [Zoogloeaceae bacterium]|jgi:NAD+ diphosphatase|nr:NAD(+) diphosphatase [Zoogloeaceae bacterium]